VFFHETQWFFEVFEIPKISQAIFMKPIDEYSLAGIMGKENNKKKSCLVFTFLTNVARF
jgi:high-affinity Fe2+/Pb2+ permease